MSQKTAVVLLNLGGPDSKNAIRPFLMNFFMDKNILRVPIPFRCLLAWMIARRRTKREAGDSYAEIGGFSPLLKNTKLQAEALEKVLNQKQETKEYKVFVCMRYWHPMSPQVVREVRDWGADEVVMLPLYPQYSTTTTRSSLQVWNKALFTADYKPKTSVICCYPENKGFLSASVENVVKVYEQALKDGHKKEDIRVLFSAHGLPESVIKEGDPYQWQCEKSAEKIAEDVKDRLGLKDMDWDICYQSRVGPMKWIGPSTEEALEKAIHDKKTVLIYPHAFTQEHVETLVEIDIEYREVAEEKGIKGFYCVPTVSTHPDFINGLAQLVNEHEGSSDVKPDGGECLCPGEYKQCCMREYEENIAI